MTEVTFILNATGSGERGAANGLYAGVGVPRDFVRRPVLSPEMREIANVRTTLESRGQAPVEEALQCVGF